MGEFGAKTQKDSWLYSAHKFIQSLPDYTSTKFKRGTPNKQVAVVIIRDDGTKNVVGGKDLKSTQEYPMGFLSIVVFVSKKKNAKTRL